MTGQGIVFIDEIDHRCGDVGSIVTINSFYIVVSDATLSPLP
jgi:hypothetical protein